MTSRDFAYWLQGFFEISETNELTERQVKMIKAHLNLVFKHEIDPSNLDGLSEKEKAEYSAIHRGAVDGDKISDFFIKPEGGFGFRITEDLHPSEVRLNC